jgi:hypothetical protein
MFNPNITPNINFGSNQDFQHHGCRQVFAQETQTSSDDPPVDIEIDTTAPVASNENTNSCTTQQGGISEEVSNFLASCV